MDQALALRLAIIAIVGILLGFGAALAAWWTRGRRGAPGEGPYWALPLAAGITYVLLHVAALGRSPWPMVSAQDRIPVAAIVAVVLAVLARRVRFPVGVRWAVRALVVLGLGVFVAWRQVSETWTTPQSVINLGGFLGATLLTWWALERVTDYSPTATDAGTQADESRPRALGAALVCSAVAGACANAMAITFSSLSLAQLAGILATVMIGVAAASLLRPRVSLAFGMAHMVAVVTQVVLLVGLITTNTPLERVYPWLVALVPTAAAVADLVLARRGTRWVRAVARVGAAALIVGAITGLAAANMPSFEY